MTGPTTTLLRVWMWLVPIGIVVTAAVFGGLAAIDESWALLSVMVVLGLFGCGLLVLHWWLLYRFGARTGNEGD